MGESNHIAKSKQNRESRIFADSRNYLIQKVRPLWADSSIPDIDVKNDLFALDSTTISLSLKLFN